MNIYYIKHIHMCMFYFPLKVLDEFQYLFNN